MSIAAVSGFGGIAEAKAPQPIVVAIAGDYAPWNMTTSTGKLTGFEPQLVDVLCKEMKVKCEIVPQAWTGMIAGLRAGKFDAIVDAISITPSRKKVIAFTEPYASTPATFEVMKAGKLAHLPGTGKSVCVDDLVGTKAKFKELRAALKGKTIGIQTGTVYTHFIDSTFGDIAHIREYSTPAERDLALSTGRIDVGFDDATYLAYALHQRGNGDLIMSGPDVVGQIWGPGEGIGLRKSETKLKLKFDAAIKDAIANGTVKRLSLKWLKVNVTPAVGSNMPCGS